MMLCSGSVLRALEVMDGQRDGSGRALLLIGMSLIVKI